MNGLLGKKMGMTQIYTEKGDCVPVTVIQVERCVPVLQRTEGQDGYQGVLVAYGERKDKHTNKPMQGVFKKLKTAPAKVLTEFRGQEVGEEELGQPLKVDMFQEGDIVDVVGVSKGRGFAGTVKRHNFKVGRRTHGNSNHRAPGSVGQCATPSRIFKGKKLPGRMGGVQCTTRNCSLVRIDTENNLLFVMGSVPGANNGIVFINKA